MDDECNLSEDEIRTKDDDYIKIAGPEEQLSEGVDCSRKMTALHDFVFLLLNRLLDVYKEGFEVTIPDYHEWCAFPRLLSECSDIPEKKDLSRIRDGIRYTKP